MQHLRWPIPDVNITPGCKHYFAFITLDLRVSPTLSTLAVLRLRFTTSIEKIR
jgi:hypothetical protein